MPRSSSVDVTRAVDVLRNGGLVAFPTETVYGLGADAANRSAVGRVFEVKGRPRGHPLIVHVPSADALDEWALDVPQVAYRLAAAFWPGPLTLLVFRRAERVPDVVTGGGERVGLRVPAHPVALELLRAFDGGIAAPSANRFGKVSPTTAVHVRADLGDDVDWVLDGGPADVGVESTIVDCTADEPEVVRPGGVTFEALRAVIGRPVGVWLGDRDVAAPGTLASALRASCRGADRRATRATWPRCATAAERDGRTVAVLAPGAIDDLPPSVRMLEPAGDGRRVRARALRPAPRSGRSPGQCAHRRAARPTAGIGARGARSPARAAAAREP